MGSKVFRRFFFEAIYKVESASQQLNYHFLEEALVKLALLKIELITIF
jgi:hypothetical protein